MFDEITQESGASSIQKSGSSKSDELSGGSPPYIYDGGDKDGGRKQRNKQPEISVARMSS